MKIWTAPNGQKVEYPDDWDESRVEAAYMQKMQQKLEVDRAEHDQQYSTMEGIPTGQRVLEGVGRGMSNVGRQVGNIVGLVEDEELAEAKEADAALMETGAGQVGNFLGETVALLPLGMGGRAGVVGASRAAQALGRGGRLAQAAPAARSAILGHGGKGVAGAANAGAQGAATGAIMAGPGDRVQGAKEGALTGAVFNKTLGALGRKITGTSPALKSVENTPYPDYMELVSKFSRDPRVLTVGTTLGGPELLAPMLAVGAMGSKAGTRAMAGQTKIQDLLRQYGLSPFYQDAMRNAAVAED